jgi:hypothetical protein
MLKDLSAIVVGVIVGLLVTVIGLLIFTSLYPQPYSLEVMDATAKTEWEQALPQSAYTLKWVINIIATFFAAILSTILAKNKKMASFGGLMIFIGIIIYRDMLHQYSLSFMTINIMAMTISGFLAIFFGSRRAKDLLKDDLLA